MTRYNGKAYYYTCSTEKASPSATEEMFFYDLVLVNGTHTNYHDDDHITTAGTCFIICLIYSTSMAVHHVA